jgi:amino acid transporter
MLGRIHPSRQTPHVSIIATGILMTVMALSLPLEEIAASTNIMFLLVFIMVCVTVVRLRRRWPDRERPFEIPFSPWLPSGGIAAGVVLSIWLLQVNRVAWAVAAGWMIVGGVIFYCRRHISK